MQIYGAYVDNRWFARGAGKMNEPYTNWREFAFTDSTILSAKSLKIFNDNAYTIMPDSSINDNDIKIIRPTNKSVEGLFESGNNANVVFNITRSPQGFYYT